MARAKALTGEVVEPEQGLEKTEDEQFVQQAGTAVREFLKGLAVFFQQATVIETAAKATLVEAKALTPPTTMEQDEHIQRFTKQTSADFKVATETWGITQTASGFHKRLVAARKRATDPLEEANGIGNRLHARYVEDEQRRVREETERNRREAEERAQRERQADLDRMEAEAIKAEEGSPILSPREQSFVELMAIGVYSAERSASQAGFKKALQEAARLMKLGKIQDAIHAKKKANELRQQAVATKARPIDVGSVEPVKAQVSKSAGTHDRTSYTAEIVDADAFVRAALSGTYGIPVKCIMPNQVELNETARSIRELIERFPGILLIKKTSIV